MTIHETIKWLKNPWHRILRDRIEELIAYVEKHEDDTPADYEWDKSRSCDYRFFIHCTKDGEWFFGQESLGKKITRGQVNHLQSVLDSLNEDD